MLLLRSRPTGISLAGILKCLHLRMALHARLDVRGLERHTYQDALQA